MNKTKLVGHGSTKFSQDDTTVQHESQKAIKALFENLNISQNDIDGVLISTNSNEKYLAPIISESSGIQPKIAHSIENLCNSGTTGIISAISYIESGLANCIMLVGVDRFDSPGQILRWDKSRGQYIHPIYWASIFTHAYKREFNITSDDLATISVKNHKNAKNNPLAYSDKLFTVSDVLESRYLTDQLRLLDCSRPCTGACAILLANSDMAKKITDTPISITGVGQKTTFASFTKNSDFTTMTSTSIAARDAFSMAHWSPQDIDVVEVHDAFSVCEPMALESIGIIPKGQGMKFCKDLYSSEDNLVNPRGGLIGAGHSLGATGIAQTIEIVQQLQGRAQKRQRTATKGLVHNMSAAATSSTILLLES